MPNTPSTTVNILAFNRDDSQTTSVKKDVKPSVQLALRYNRLSSLVRALRSKSNNNNNNNNKAVQHQVALDITADYNFQSTPTLKWQLLDLSLSVDSHCHSGYAASFLSTADGDVASSQRLFVHFPALGTSIEYNVSSLLNYGESLRQDSAEGVAASEASPKAPMPCKVLNMLKKNGDKVKVGEIAVVVESMKMEMNIVAAVEGVFQSSVSKGEAVEEGTVLFTIS